LKVLFDTNIVLDVLLERKPFHEAATHLFTYVESGVLEGYLCATTMTTIHYLATKAIGRRNAKAEIERLLQLFDTAPVNRRVLEDALKADNSDFEDAVLAASAHHAGMDCLVTRNPKDFARPPLPIHSPEALLKIVDDAGLI
jgi:predicted nucleic acid-binding protein